MKSLLIFLLLFTQFSFAKYAPLNEQILSVQKSQTVRAVGDQALDLARGLYENRKSFHRFGFNETVPNGSFADIWAYGPTDATYNWPVTAEKFRVRAGGNANDTAAGSGARTLQILYLDDDGDEVQEQLTLAGASASGLTTVTGTRVIRAWVDTAGTVLSNNTGLILIENETSGQIVGAITAGVGQTQLSQYTIPKGYTGYLKNLTVTVDVNTNREANIRLWQRTNALTFSAPFGVKRLVHQSVGTRGSVVVPFAAYPKFEELTDLWLEAEGQGSTTSLDVTYDLILIKNDTISANAG